MHEKVVEAPAAKVPPNPAAAVHDAHGPPVTFTLLNVSSPVFVSVTVIVTDCPCATTVGGVPTTVSAVCGLIAWIEPCACSFVSGTWLFCVSRP